MQAIIGGAYNGKRKYVKESLKHIAHEHIYAFEGEIPEQHFTKEDYVIIGNFENIISNSLHLKEEEIVNEIITKLKELNNATNVICICTDIGRGIVPLSSNDRKLRDTCGRLYQQLFTYCEKVIRVWYGIPEILKEEYQNGKK